MLSPQRVVVAKKVVVGPTLLPSLLSEDCPQSTIVAGSEFSCTISYTFSAFCLLVNPNARQL